MLLITNAITRSMINIPTKSGNSLPTISNIAIAGIPAKASVSLRAIKPNDPAINTIGITIIEEIVKDFFKLSSSTAENILCQYPCLLYTSPSPRD